MRTACPNCLEVYDLEDQYSETEVTCPDCGHSFMPVAIELPPPPPPPPTEAPPKQAPVVQETLPPNMDRCKTCQQLIAKSAQVCPHCGEKSPHQIQPMQVLGGCLIMLVLLALFMWGFHSCSNSSKSSGPTKSEAWVEAKAFVRNQLKSPSTADFPWLDTDIAVTEMGDGYYSVVGYVDSQNSFGATIRTNFTLTLRYRNGSWYLDGDIFFF